MSSSNSSPNRIANQEAQLISHSSDEGSNTSHEDQAIETREERDINLRALGMWSGNTAAQLNRINAITGERGYPMSHNSDIDDNDDVVSINDSLNVIHQSANRGSTRITDIGTIQSANPRRVIEQNLSSNRRNREESKHNASQNLEELFKCFICFGKIDDAVICPSCSKLCCRSCMRKWLVEQR